MVKNKNGVYQFISFIGYPHLVHGFSTKDFGNMAKEADDSSFHSFAATFGIGVDQTVRMDQVHGNKVAYVSEKEKGSYIPDADGMVTDRSGMLLSVRSADCVPVLAYDEFHSVIGVAHAGWKGALSGIAGELISEMGKLGSVPQHIRIGLGPSIRDCCYTIDKDREATFADAFPRYREHILTKKDDQIFLSLQTLIRLQLRDKGIQESMIEDSGICTKDNATTFYSFRDTKDAGLFAGVIGMI